MGIPALIAGGAALAGGAYAAHRNKRMAEKQMDFQERMSSTAYQRAVEDMRLAGINPMLAYAQGGASSPAGQTATIEDVAGPAVSSAMHAKRLSQELKNMRETETLIRDQEQKTRFEAQHAAAQKDFVWTQAMMQRILLEEGMPQAQMRQLLAGIDQTETMTELAKLDIPRMQNIANLEQLMREASPGLRMVIPLLRLFFGGSTTNIHQYPRR